eukprot:1758907-Pyramimonas_sp.AAC.1
MLLDMVRYLRAPTQSCSVRLHLQTYQFTPVCFKPGKSNQVQCDDAHPSVNWPTSRRYPGRVMCSDRIEGLFWCGYEIAVSQCATQPLKCAVQQSLPLGI